MKTRLDDNISGALSPTSADNVKGFSTPPTFFVKKLQQIALNSCMWNSKISSRGSIYNLTSPAQQTAQTSFICACRCLEKVYPIYNSDHFPNDRT